MKGDYLDVTYRTGTGTNTVRVQAKHDGTQLVWDEPKSTARYLSVEVVGRTDKVLERHLFAAGEVVAVKSGHENPPKRTARKVKSFAADLRVLPDAET